MAINERHCTVTPFATDVVGWYRPNCRYYQLYKYRHTSLRMPAGFKQVRQSA